MLPVHYIAVSKNSTKTFTMVSKQQIFKREHALQQSSLLNAGVAPNVKLAINNFCAKIFPNTCDSFFRVFERLNTI